MEALCDERGVPFGHHEAKVPEVFKKPNTGDKAQVPEPVCKPKTADTPKKIPGAYPGQNKDGIRDLQIREALDQIRDLQKARGLP